MPGKHTITNLLLFLIASALLLTGAQGGFVQLSPLLTASPEEETTTITTETETPTPANADAPSTNEDETTDKKEGQESPSLSFLERLLAYALLMSALVYGVETGVELLRWALSFERVPGLLRPKTEPGPTEILKALNPWLPKPGVVPSETREEKESQDEIFRAQKGALRGIVQQMVGGNLQVDWDWPRIFWTLAREEQTYLQNEENRIRWNRALSFLVAIVFASLTGLNTFDILLGPAEATKVFPHFSTHDLWYKWGGIALSAFVASAGSSVWHDLLDRLRLSKEKAEPEEEEDE